MTAALRTQTAAAMLGVSPSTLRGWEARYGHPTAHRSDGGHRQFELSEIEDLAEALARCGGDAPAAIRLALSGGRRPGSPLALRGAFASFDAEGADRLLEESLAARGVERTVDEVILKTFEALDEDSPEQAFAWSYATGWLAAALRLAPPASRPQSVLLFEAGRRDSLHTQALELCLRRRGLRTLTLPAQLDHARVGRAVRALMPVAALVLSGRGAELDQLGRLVYACRQAAGALAVFDFRGALPESGASVLVRLAASAPAACEELLQAAVDGGEQRVSRAVRAHG
ncbi:MAG: MerR family DNA-binding transcriptional regulator [Solirubrobacteraceae bacterium]